MFAMFSQDFFLAIILQDSSPGEGQFGAGCAVGWGWQGQQRWRMCELGDRDRRVYVTDTWCMCQWYVHDMCTCVSVAAGVDIRLLGVWLPICVVPTHVFGVTVVWYLHTHVARLLYIVSCVCTSA